jgi:small subunit ribosomal protein S1
VGNVVETVVLSADADGHRIALGMKQLGNNPWDNIQDKFKIGDAVTGKIVKLTNFGAFVELVQGIDGFIHIGQIREERVEKIRDILKVGEEVTARVIKIDAENERIALSIKALDYDSMAFQSEINACKDSNPGEFGTLGDLFSQ